MAVDLEYYGVPPADYREQENRTRITATAGQTTFSGPYSPGYVDVYFNGAKLDPFTEFTGTDGANIILASAAALGDIVEIISRAQVQIANVYTQAQVNALLVPYFAVSSGTGDAQVAVTNPTFTTFVDGMTVKIRTVAANASTTPTINCNSLGAVTIVSNNSGGALYGSDWTAGSEISLRYNQTLSSFVLLEGQTTVVTPPQFNKTNQSASTAFVQQAIGNTRPNVVLVNSATTLTLAQSGQVVNCNTGTGTLTLPSSGGASLGLAYYVNNYGTSVLTVTSVAGTAIFNPGTTTTTYSMQSGTSAIFISDGGNWVVFGGGGIGSIASNGFLKVSSGLILQWGTATSSGAATTVVTYPVAFPNNTLSVSATAFVAGAGAFCAIETGGSTTSVSIGAWTSNAARSAGIPMKWIAVGY